MHEAAAQIAETSGTKRHSRFGIASFVISLFVGLAEFSFIALAVILTAISPSGQLDEKSLLAILLGLSIVGAGAVSLVGLGLGLAGWITTNEKRVFCVLGIIFNLAVLVSIGVMMVIDPNAV